MFLLLPILLVFAFLFWRLVRPLKTNLLVKFVLIILILALLSKFSVYSFWGGSVFSPNLPKNALIFLEGSMGAALILCFAVLLRDVFLLLFWKKKWQFHRNSKWAFGLFFLSFLIGQWGSIQAASVPEVKNVTVFLEKLPKELDGLKIVQLTDTHILRLLDKDWLNQVVEKTNAQHADLIFLTGDYADALPETLKESIEGFGKLKARYGVFGVSGNHEYYSDAAAWFDFLKKQNITMLDNAHIVLSIRKKELVIAGMPDPTQGRLGGNAPNIEQTLKQAPLHAPIILLNHQPKGAQRHAQNGVDLQLSGHTHGGVMFFLKPLVAAFNEGFVHGLYSVGNMQLYVSGGTGLWGGFSCRILVPSEITLLTLRKKV